MQAPPRVLFIGLDAGDIDLIERWTNEGALPNLRALKRTAASAVTSLPPRLYSGAIWPSLFTGVTPARHGCYHHLKLEADYEISEHRIPCSRAAFWDELGRLNRRVAIIDVPYAPLIDGLNGMQIVDWTSHEPAMEVHGRDSISSIRTSPQALAAEVIDRFGKDEVGHCEQPGRSVEEFRDFRDRLLARIEKKTALCLHYLEQERWDLFLAVFADSHCVGHQCWQVHDPSHPLYDSEVARAIGDPIKDIYIALDAAIGRILERAGPETTAFVFASHGMAAIYDGNFMLDHILNRLDEGRRQTGGLSAIAVLNRTWERLPNSLRTVLRPLRNRWKGRVREALLQPARRVSRCFMLPTGDNCGGIRVNLVGREPNGRVRPGEEYRALCASLTRDLLALTDPETGERLIDGVYRYEDLFPAAEGPYNADLYNGSYLGDLPDLLVVWSRPNITSVHSPVFGTITQVYQGSRTADHGQRGLLFVRGLAIEPGALAQEISILDFAPSMAALLGVELGGVDGMPIAALGARGSATRDEAGVVARSDRS